MWLRDLYRNMRGYRAFICYMLLGAGVVNLLVGVSFLYRLSRTNTSASVSVPAFKQQEVKKAERKSQPDIRWIDQEPSCARRR
ncbi:hypothetical protein E2C01_092398 [Portunus trituberculatus]|uniref:Uncharacterized protein n=1 Tax=Portunus trituberculatus TaxID=210409 RepID=A0A5B7JR94_PORTR|nr:hypothetical protein [Portunus trituberculatus]